MQSFWNRLPKPFFCLAPMADVTDPAFRKLIAEIAKPHVMWTEFVSADGLYHTREPQKDTAPIYGCDDENPLMRDLQFSEKEHPIVAQIFSGKPDMIAYASALAEELGFDGVDINMGCPDASIEKQGSGAALMKDHERAKGLIRAAKDATKLPVSLKTRIGYGKEALDEWLSALLEAEPAAIVLHLRTRREMSNVPAHWELMARAIALRDAAGSKTLLIGNGDAKDVEDARAKAAESGADGVMLGRAIFGNPWLFAGRKPEDAPPAEKLAALVTLARYFEELRPAKSFHILKKHIKAFVSGFDGAAELRAKLMETESATELSAVVNARTQTSTL